MRTTRKLCTTTGVFAATFVLVAITSVTASASVKEVPSPTKIVRQLLPSARVEIRYSRRGRGASANGVPSPYSSNGEYAANGAVMTITLPASAIPADQTAQQALATYQELGWRAGLTAGAVDATSPVASYQVQTSSGQVPTAAYNYFHGSFAAGWSPGSDPALDTWSQTTGLQQLQSNLNVLESVLPPGSITNSSIQALPLGSGGDEYALEADITLTNALDLQGHYGDALAGMQTGLLDVLSQSPIEGLAIVYTAADGTPIVGEWSDTRAGSGVLSFADPSSEPSTMSVTTTFPNETGLGTVATVVTGGSAAATSARPPSTRPYSQLNGGRQQVKAARDNGSSSAWWIGGGAALVIAFAVLSLWVRRKRQTERQRATERHDRSAPLIGPVS